MIHEGEHGRQVDHIGAHLFGRPARLRIAIWVNGQTDRFWQKQAADGAGVPAQYVKSELAHLATLGMIQPINTDDLAERRNFYQRVDHPLWNVIAAANDAIEELSGIDSPAGRHLTGL